MNPTSKVVAYAKATIKHSARGLVGKCGITPDDLEDIKSEMMLDVLERLPKHDQKWSYKTFIPWIVKNKSNSILRSRCTDKAAFFRATLSMDAPLCVAGEYRDEEFTLHDVVSAESQQEAGKISGQELENLKKDIKIVLASLSNIQRRSCEAIMDEQPISKICKDNGLPRGTFCKYVIEPIREAFKEAGLEDYLK
jgi:DNA-directed RNA polymerase specialized sigma24 family protein